MLSETQPLLTVRQAAHALNVSPHGLYKRLRTGELPYLRFGRKILIDLEQVREAMRRAASREGELAHAR